MMEEAIQAYRLRGNPFAGEPLNPLHEVGDGHLVAPVDGWKRQGELEAFLTARVANGGPAVVIAAGSSGTGRSSLANVAINHWLKQRGTDANKLIVVPWEVDNFDPTDQMWRWGLKIRSVLLQTNSKLSDATERELAVLRQAKPAALGASLGDVLQLIVRDLAQEGVALVSVIEGVNDKSFFTVARDSLEFVNMLVVMTVNRTRATEETVLSETSILVDPGLGHFVQLRELSGPDVCALVKWRWQRFSDDDLPFDVDGISSTFDEPPRSLSRVLSLVERLLVLKTNTLPSGSWPSEPGLFLSAKDIDLYVKVVDGSLDEGAQ
jgi:hypothetical protein